MVQPLALLEAEAGRVEPQKHWELYSRPARGRLCEVQKLRQVVMVRFGVVREVVERRRGLVSI